MKRLNLTSLALCIVTLLGVVRSAHAEEDLLEQAIQRYSEADFQGSIQLLNRAALTTNEPKALAQVYLYLGINHEVLGDNIQAAHTFRKALMHDRSLALDPQRFRLSAVTLFDQIKKSLAPASRPVPVPPPASQPASAPTSLPASVPTATPAVASTQPAIDAPLDPLPPEPPAASGRLWTWVAAGSAVASLGLAIGLGAWARADHQSWEAVRTEGTDRPRWEKLASSGQDKQLAANLFFGVTGMLAVGAVVLYFIEGQPAQSSDSGVAALRADGLVVQF